MAEVPTDVLRWALAAVPLVVLLVLLAGLRWKAPEAGGVGLLIATGLALLVFRADYRTVAVAGAKGIWDAVFVLYVVWAALLLYHVVKAAGGFEALQEGIRRYTENRLFLVLAFGWVFASFLQGIAGFGVPIAVVAPLLVGIGVRPVYAVAIPLIGHAWANLFGTLAVAWLATTRVVDLAAPVATAYQSAVLLWIPNLLAGFTIAWLYGRWGAIRQAWPLVLIVSLAHGGIQLGLALWNPVLAAFVATTVALVLLYPLSRWGRYSNPAEGVEEAPAIESEEEKAEDEPEPAMGFPLALMPYLVLIVATLLGLAIPQVADFLGRVEVGPPFPGTKTGYGIESDATGSYSPFAPFAHPGFFLLLAAVVAWAIYRARGLYEKWERRTEPQGILRGVLDDAIPASVAVAAFLVMSKVMDGTGQTDVLALGVAAVAPPPVYAFVANGIGAVGSFMTSSNTASNILFAPLQQETAAAFGALSESHIIAAQNAGGAVGNAISPANVVLGTGTAGIVGQEGDVLRKVLPWAGAAVVLVGFGTLLLGGLGGLGV